MLYIAIVILVLIILFSIAIVLKAFRKGIHVWAITYIKDKIILTEKVNPDEPIHIMLCIVDHFEPGNGKVNLTQARERVGVWILRYPELADRHRDADGKPPQHTWFFPPHYDQADHLERMVGLCKRGYGEIELHLHHDHHPPFPENETSLAQKIEACLDEYSRYGIWGRLNGKAVYAFIHGNWALDNSANGNHCGVNDELQILKATGCYADFTFPSGNQCQPKLTNRIFYALDEPNKPKSHNTGKPITVGGREWGDLMIIQGPLGFRWKSRLHRFRPTIETAEIDHTNLPTKDRVDFWIKSGIRISGRPNWIFIKLHCHGAPDVDHESLLGKPAHTMYSYLESKYNDGGRYILHYVTAREMYNIIKAVESDRNGSPSQYRDYIITKPTYNNSKN